MVLRFASTSEKEFREFFDEFFDRFIRVFDDLIIEQLRKDAGEGDVEAQFHLGYMYAEGEEAAKWYRKAAEQGDSKAQFFLGHMYYEGEGIPKDDREVLKWWREAAEQGFVLAQSWLGIVYQQGELVPKDDREAAKWYRMAAEQGDVLSQSSLGDMHYFGAVRLPRGWQPNCGSAERRSFSELVLAAVRVLTSGLDRPVVVGVRRQLQRWRCHCRGQQLEHRLERTGSEVCCCVP